MEFTVCERNTWMKVIPTVSMYTCDKCYEGEELGLEGEIREELKEEWRKTSKTGLGELSEQREYYTPWPPSLEM